MNPAPHRPANEPSDARYIFILFALIFVVLFFAFLIYFVYGQKQFSILTPADNPTFEKTVPEEIAQNNDKLDNGSTTAATATVATTVPVKNELPSTVVSIDPTRYNPRDLTTTQLHGRALLDRYFSSIQSADYQTACSLLTNSICNARRDIYSFSQFLNKTSGGYQVQNITLAKEQKPSEAIYCVEYTYSLKADLNPQPVSEYFQYRIKTRPDGVDEISARVCEKIIKDGRERPCPIITPKKYCF